MASPLHVAPENTSVPALQRERSYVRVVAFHEYLPINMNSTRPLILGSLMGSVGFACLTWLNLVHDKENNTYYLDNWGIVAAVWVVILLAWSLFLVNPIEFELANGQSTWDNHPPQADRSSGLASGSLRRAFEVNGINDLRVIKFMFLIGRGVLNIVSITHHTAVLPPRHPNDPMDASKYIVAAIEAPVMCCIVLALIIMILKGVSGRCRSGKTTHRIVSNLYNAAQFSALRLILFANPIKYFKTWKRETRAQGRIYSVAHLLSAIIVIMAAVSSLMLKVREVSFIINKHWWEWSRVEVMQLWAFVNSVSGIYPDDDQLRIDGKLEYFLPANGSTLGWRINLVEKLVGIYGQVNAVIIYTTLTAEDANSLLKEDLAEPP